LKAGHQVIVELLVGVNPVDGHRWGIGNLEEEVVGYYIKML
jgi:hypothetical protein